jgi:hypothetical protein
VEENEELGAPEKTSVPVMCPGFQELSMKTTDALPKTFVFGTLAETPQNPGVYAPSSVPKAVPKSKYQYLTYSVGFSTFVI